MPTRKVAESRLARKVRVGHLLEIYGVLLTERQREFVNYHHNEDMSFGEIAGEFGISRQAVHDAVRQAETAMENYEAGLGLLAKGVGPGSEKAAVGDPAGAKPAAGELREILAELTDFRNRLAAQGIVYDAEERARALDSVIGRLEALAGE